MSESKLDEFPVVLVMDVVLFFWKDMSKVDLKSALTNNKLFVTSLAMNNPHQKHNQIFCVPK